MGVLAGAERRRLKAGDRIRSLPDDVLCNIVSLLPTKAGARTQVLSSGWRHLWRAAPLNLELRDGHDDDDDDSNRRGIRASVISRILSVHPGPCRRFIMPFSYAGFDYPTLATFDGWLRSRALHSLQELRFDNYPLLQLPPSLGRFSLTLRVASFRACAFPTPDGNSNGRAPLLCLPVLESLTLSEVTISQTSLRALLAGSPVLQSLLLFGTYGFPRLEIVSPSLRNIRLGAYWRTHELIIEDAPSLETLQCSQKMAMNISVISAPRLAILGDLCGNTPRLQFGTIVLQGSTVVTMAAAVNSVKVLFLSGVKLCLYLAINLLKCFPHLEKLHIKATSVCVENAWYQTNPERIGILNIHVRKIVLENYQGSKSHVDFVNFFLSNARALESLELGVRNITTNKWIARQHSLLSINSASRDPQVTFVSHKKTIKR